MSKNDPIVVDRGRTNTILVKLGYDVSSDVISSEIRREEDQGSTLIATWSVGFLTDGTDGDLVLTLDDSVTGAVTQNTGFMDLKRVTGGEPVSAISKPIPVIFQGTVTA